MGVGLKGIGAGLGADGEEDGRWAVRDIPVEGGGVGNLEDTGSGSEG